VSTMRTWAGMRDSIEARLRRQTDHDVPWWNARTAAAGTFGPVGIQARKTAPRC
jgi:hypothetical protein